MLPRSIAHSLAGRLVGALGLLLLGMANPHAAFFDPVAYLAVAGNAADQAIPAQSVTFTDDFGRFSSSDLQPALGTGTPGAWVPYQGLGVATPLQRPLPSGWQDYGAAGSVQGSYLCASFATACLGIRTITYQLPFAIEALSGDLTARVWFQFPLTTLPFFEFTGREPAIPPGGAFGSTACAPGSCYSGFWGQVFDTPTSMLTIPWRPFDGGAGFLLANARVIPVPEPGSLLLLATGLIGLTLLRRQRSAAPRAPSDRAAPPPPGAGVPAA